MQRVAFAIGHNSPFKMVGTCFKFTLTSLLLMTTLILAEPQGNQIVHQDVAQEADEQFIDSSNGGRGGDQWWKNYETVEEHANNFDDQLEMIYMYRVNPLDLTTKQSKVRQTRPTTQEILQTTASPFVGEPQFSRPRQRPQLQKVEFDKNLQGTQSLHVPVVSEPPLIAPPQPTLPRPQFTPHTPLRRLSPTFKTPVEPRQSTAQPPQSFETSQSPQSTLQPTQFTPQVPLRRQNSVFKTTVDPRLVNTQPPQPVETPQPTFQPPQFTPQVPLRRQNPTFKTSVQPNLAITQSPQPVETPQPLQSTFQPAQFTPQVPLRRQNPTFKTSVQPNLAITQSPQLVETSQTPQPIYQPIQFTPQVPLRRHNSAFKTTVDSRLVTTQPPQPVETPQPLQPTPQQQLFTPQRKHNQQAIQDLVETPHLTSPQPQFVPQAPLRRQLPAIKESPQTTQSVDASPTHQPTPPTPFQPQSVPQVNLRRKKPVEPALPVLPLSIATQTQPQLPQSPLNQNLFPATVTQRPVTTQTPVASTQKPSLPLVFIPGPRSTFPSLPFNFRSIPNAIPLPAHLFQQKPIKTKVQQQQKQQPNRQPLQSIPLTTTVTSVDVNAIPSTDNPALSNFQNAQQDLTPRNSRLRVRVRRPTSHSTDKPNLDDKTLFDVVVPKKADNSLEDKPQITLLTHSDSDTLTHLSAAPSSNSPQRVAPTQNPRRLPNRRGSPHSLPTQDTTPAAINHPFLAPTTPSTVGGENLPRYVRLLNRYSLLEPNGTAAAKKNIHTQQNGVNDGQTNGDNHPPSARVFNVEARKPRRRRPTSPTEQAPTAVTDSVSSDSEEVASFNRINSRTQRRRLPDSANTRTISSTTNSPATTTIKSSPSTRPDRSRRRHGSQSTELPSLSTATTSTTIRPTTVPSASLTISRRPLKRGRGFGFHLTSSTTTTTSTENPENIEATLNPEEPADEGINIEQNGVPSEALKTPEENDLLLNKQEDNAEETNQPNDSQSEAEEVDNQPQPSGLRRRKFNFKRKSPVTGKPPSSNNSSTTNNQPIQSGSSLKSKPKSGTTRRPTAGSASFKSKSPLTTTSSSVDATTKRRTFRFKPKVTKFNAASEAPSTTEAVEFFVNDTTEAAETDEEEELPVTTTTSETPNVSRAKPGRGSLFARPGSAKRARTVPSTNAPLRTVTTPTPAANTQQNRAKKPFVSRFRTTTTVKPTIAEDQTSLNSELIAETPVSETPTTPITTSISVTERTTAAATFPRQKSRFNFSPRVSQSPATSVNPITEFLTAPTTVTTITTTSVPLFSPIGEATQPPFASNRLGKRRRRPLADEVTSAPQNTFEVPTTLISTTTSTTTPATISSTLDVDALALLNINHDFDRKISDVETSTFAPLTDVNLNNNTFSSASDTNDGPKRRKQRRRKITQRSTSGVGFRELILSAANVSGITNAILSTTEAAFSNPQPSQNKSLAPTNATVTNQQKPSNLTSEKSKALAKKELWEKIALKTFTQSYQQNGFSVNTDEPLIMAADDSGVWFSNPDESSASDNHSPPLSFISNVSSSRSSRTKRIQTPEVRVSDGKRLIQIRRQSSNSEDGDSWFSGGAPSTEQVSIDRSDDTVEPETASTSNDRNDGADTSTTENSRIQEKPRAVQKSRSATFSVSSSTSVQSETSKRRSSTSKQRIKDFRPISTTTTTQSSTIESDDDGFRIEELGPPRVIVIDKVTMRFPDNEATTTKTSVIEEKDFESETERSTTTEKADTTTSRALFTDEDVTAASRDETTTSRRESVRDRNRFSNRGTTTTTTTTTEPTTETDLNQEFTTSAAPEETTKRKSSDEVGYFGPEEVEPEAKGALDGPLDDTHYDGGSEAGDSGEVAAVNVSEHNDDEGGHLSEPAPGDEASIWELSPLTDFSGPFSESSSFKVEVRSKAPKTIQVANKRETSRSVAELMRPLYNLMAKQQSRLGLFDNPTNQIRIPTDEEFDDSRDDFFHKLQALQYDTTADKSLDGLTTSTSWNSDSEPFYEDDHNDLNATSTQSPSTASENQSVNSTKPQSALNGPTNCSRSDRNVCPIGDDYPRMLVESVVKQNEEMLRELWQTLHADRNPAQIYPEDNEDENSKNDLSVCDSTVETLRPGWARDAKDGKWMVIINTPSFPQFIRAELCLRLKKECLFISPYYRSSCTEHHSAHRLVAIDPQNPSGPVIGIFKFPCGCSCKVEMFHGRN